jgi:hypothetical protein
VHRRFGARRLAAPVALSMCTVASAQAPKPAPGDVPITSAVFRVERRAIPGLVLHVENLRDAPLQTWVLGIGTSWQASDRSRDEPPYARGDGPILWREVRAIRFTLDPSQSLPPEAVVKLAVFEDGWTEGEKDHVDAWVRVRERRVENASYWLDVLDRARGKTDEETKAILRAALVARRLEIAERGARPGGPLDAWGEDYASSNLASLANETTPRPDGWLARVLVHHRDQLMNFRRAMMRPLFHAPSAAGQTGASRVGSVAVRVVNEPMTSVFVTIENLRDVPIEAYEFRVYESPTQVGPSSGHRSDNCIVIDGPGERIQPREVRSIQLGDRAVTPAGQLRFVLYDDLTFEGSIEARNELFKRRERDAEEYAYWIAALGEARSKPPAEIREFLTTKRREWIQENENDRQSLLQQMQQMASFADTRPDAIHESIDARRARMERVRQALTRHLKR